ncbi:hypothetical protein [uncultured Pyramidobacter sp.]|uniref:hypothetical protein n=1 Tax=uncultured Pyramidobacter sp. TaxID=1623495 RepID=UPI0028062B38|nr:hypothetical protein [uncultured Pyramidobacter sp.]
MVRGTLPPIITRISQNPREPGQGEMGTMRGEGSKVDAVPDKGSDGGRNPREGGVLFVMTGKFSRSAPVNVSNAQIENVTSSTLSENVIELLHGRKIWL